MIKIVVCYAVNVFDVDALGAVDIASSFEADQIQLKPPSPSHSSKSPRQSSSKSRTSSKSETKSKSSSSKKKSKQLKKQAALKQEPSDEDFFANLGLQTVDDLLGGNVRSLDDGSEIASDIEEQDSRDDRSPSPLRSILSPSPKPDKTPRSSRSRVHYSLEEITEVRSRSPSPEVIDTARQSSYADDFEQDSVRSESIRTEQPTSDVDSISERLLSGKASTRRRLYSDDFRSSTESKWSSTRRDLRRSESIESNYSDTFSDDVSDSRVDVSRYDT